MVYYFFYNKIGYDHLDVNGDGQFRPEIVRAVNLIEHKVSKLESKDRTVTNKLEQAKQQLQDVTDPKRKRSRR